MSRHYQAHRRPESNADRSVQRAGTPGRAKVTPPRLRNVLARERLFRLLNGLREHALIWLSAPAGSGKTTLVASWAQTLEADLVWYQCDEGDGDIASFFHFLSLAVQQTEDSRARLPRLTPELYASLTVFTRNYFREFFARLQTPAVVVLDNWQEVPGSAALRDCLPVILNEVPRGITLVALSREAPAANLSRALSTGQMATIHWRELQLTEAETAGVAALYEPMLGQTTVPTARELYAATHGWAAGVAMLLRYDTPVKLLEWRNRNFSIQAVFDYLASEIFDRLEPSLKEFMVKTACLEGISVPVARELTGNEQAKDILDRLVSRNVFTVQRPGSGTYQYHLLLKEFLRNRADAVQTPIERRIHMQRAAAVLIKNGEAEPAIALLLQAESWDEAIRLVIEYASTLMTSGRTGTLSGWLDSIPARFFDRSPWLLYWRARCRLMFDPVQARADLEPAFSIFKAESDVAGVYLTCAVMLESYNDGTALGSAQRWVDEIQIVWEQHHAFPSPAIEAQIVSSLMASAAFVDPAHELLRTFEPRAEKLMRASRDPQQCLWLSSLLLWLALWRGDFSRAGGLVKHVKLTVDERLVSPSSLLLWKIWEGHYYWCLGSYQESALVHQQITATANETGVHLFDAQAAQMMVYCALSAGDVASAQHWHEAAEALIDRRNLLQLAQQAVLNAGILLLQGNPKAALKAAQYGLECHDKGGAPYPLAENRLVLARILIDLGQTQSARDLVSAVVPFARQMRSPLLEQQCLLIEAWSWVKDNVESNVLEALRGGLRLARENNHALLEIWWRPTSVSSLLVYALEHGIEVEYCRYLIEKRHLKPPAYDIEHWPWPVKIHTLGQFAVVVDGEQLELGGKTQHKPLSLLKALLLDRVGLGSATLLDYLWPDLDGDAARNALDLALHRLRRLLNRKNAVLYQDGRVMLDHTRVWVDAWALQTLCEQGVSLPQNDALVRAEKMLRLYRGHFLVDEEKEWVFAARDRLRSQFVRRLSALVKVVEAHGQGEELIALLSRTIETEPLNEPFHRALIRCYRAQGRHTESVAAYRRCRELFGRLCGTEPSAQTRSLVQDLVHFPESESHLKDIRC